MKTILKGLLLVLALLSAFTTRASVGTDTLGQGYLTEALSAVEAGDRGCFFTMLAAADDAYRASGDLEGWLKLYKEAGKALRQSTWADAVPQAVAVMQRGLRADFGRSPVTPEEWDALIWLHVNLGYIHLHYQDDYPRALAEYEAAYRLFQQHFDADDYYTVNYIYRPLANLYSRFGDFQTAIGLLSTSYRYFKSSARTGALVKVLNDLSIAEELAGQREASLGHINEALHLGGLSPKDLVLLHSARARVLGAMGQNEQALSAIDEAFRALPQVTQVPPAYLREWEGTLWQVRGSITAALRRWSTSADDFGKGATILSAAGHIRYRRSLAKLLVDKGEMLRQKGDYLSAVQCQQEAIQALLPGYSCTDWQEMPTVEMLYAENTFSEALTGWANSLWQWYEQEGGQVKLQQILSACDLVFEVEQMLRRRYQGESAKLSSVQGIRARTELGVMAALELWEQTQQSAYKEVAFELAERSRSLLLREAMQKATAERQADLPAEVLQRERELQQTLADYEEQWFRLQLEEEATGALEAAEEALLHQRQAYAAWIDSLEQHFPHYYQEKYNLEVATLAQVKRELLQPGQALVEYFMGAHFRCAFVVTPNSLEVIDLDKAFPLAEKGSQWRTAIEQFQFGSSDRQALCEVYRQVGYELYEVLLSPIEAQMQLPEQLLIVPGGVLGLLPFDALLTEPAGHCDFRSMPYLINDYEIGYAYSATFQRAVQQRAANGKGLVAFAPAFDGRGGFGALAYNEPQAAAVASLFSGRAYLDQEATREQLSVVVKEAGLLHFSTHAQANTETGDFSFIVFSDGKGGYDSLFVKDIYLLPLQAELVVLNGCETFVGKWYDGEGVINLARSFLAAGANSVVSSLWAINDDASSSVIEAFYTGLKGGDARSAALRSAKLGQVASGGKLGAHPVYWAAFHAVGKPGKLPASGGGSRLLLWSVVISGLLLGVVYWRFQL
ncbi:MAG: CHAT domain-containing tetratricopeptide repeat protein [Phaeodactylibacter sp.]|uniref:CHAT domain-containing protein n=1 Tax=Phaeodactylibacter sp. TaxID=1940289 RepID=UPI0032EC703E